MSITWLRWALAGVLGAGGGALAVSCLQTGRPAVLLVLGAAELVAAALFVVPRTLRAGGFALLAVLAVAAVLHAATGEAPPLAFVVYAAGIWAVMAERRRAAVAP
jgi:hypothetical protein